MAAGTGWRSMSPQEKKAFYALASKKELTDTYARARFEREPWYLTDIKIRKEMMNGDLARISDKECG